MLYCAITMALTTGNGYKKTRGKQALRTTGTTKTRRSNSEQGKTDVQEERERVDADVQRHKNKGDMYKGKMV